MNIRTVFVAGGTGYIGTGMIRRLVEKGHIVRALVRKGSESRLPPGVVPIFGNALDASTFSASITPADTFVQLVGVAHPGPGKARLFREIDLVSAQQSVDAARKTGIQHFVYLSVAQPAPVMKDYQAVRIEGERLLRESGMNATIIRPWYVLGPGHRWPHVLKPVYWMFEMIPSTREQALRLGLVTLDEMVSTLVHAVENPERGITVLEVPQIRSLHFLQESQR